MEEILKTKICIACDGDSMDSSVDYRFSRCQYFLIVNPETDDFSAVLNTSAAETGDVGVVAAQQVIENNVGVVIAGSVGNAALGTLLEARVKVFSGAFSKTANEALKAYKNGELTEMATAT